MALHFELNSLSMISTRYWHFTEKFQKLQKQTVVQWGDTISRQLSLQDFVRLIGRVSLWSYGWLKYPSPGSTRTFFCWNCTINPAQSTFCTVQFIPQIPHNFNFSRTLSGSLVITLVTAFIWNSEVTFLLVSIIWRNTMCASLQDWFCCGNEGD